ncbi:TIGR04086 family membrane protein [Clostridium aestuarii]|uniref:TIGR04086 family membrane protein n=1 Tax=Clostridium aestuarii TaxID=338193 RepID=A0ABT4CXA0_9CLOT|nr:TIGR04086 family membrane protein [Clostridium aestuarii]
MLLLGEKGDIIYIGEGLVRGFFLTLVLLLVYAVATSFVNANTVVDSIYKVVITALGVMYGTVYAVKKIKRKGWLTGLIVALLYMLVIYVISVVNGRQFTISAYGILRIVLAIFVGILSGMLGINM